MRWSARLGFWLSGRRRRHMIEIRTPPRVDMGHQVEHPVQFEHTLPRLYGDVANVFRYGVIAGGFVLYKMNSSLFSSVLT